MTATNRKASRVDADFYPTPEQAVHSLLKVWQPPFTGGWLEPCVGDGAIIRATSNFYLNSQMPEWTAVELRPDADDFMQMGLFAAEVDWHIPQDFLTWQPKKQFNVCLTNPPFSLAMEFILHAMKMCERVAMLLRLDYLGTQVRYPFHRDHPADVYVLSRRPFPDACEYAWFVWGEGGGRLQVLEP